MIGSWSGGPRSTPWLTWLCYMKHFLAKTKTILRVRKQYQGKGSKFSSRISLFMQPDSCILHKQKIAPISTLLKALPDHHTPRLSYSSKFHSKWKTLRLVGLSRSLSNHQITRWREKQNINLIKDDDLSPVLYGPILMVSDWHFFANSSNALKPRC